MPSYHSVFNKKENLKKLCGIPVFEFKEKKTPTLDHTKLKVDLKQIELDIIDEAIIYFRANVLFKNFNIEGDADKLLVYITVFIQKCLEKANDPNQQKAKENILQLSVRKHRDGKTGQTLLYQVDFDTGNFTYVPSNDDGNEPAKRNEKINKIKKEYGDDASDVF